MPSKKDCGQQPAKPKPEDLIAQFKMKFEYFSSETKHSLDQVRESHGNLRENQQDLEKQAKISAQEDTQNINDFTEKPL